MMKEVVCKKCNGYGFISYCQNEENWASISCKSCNECHGTGKIMVPMTMADRIREMNDEEIARVLLDWFCVGNKEYYTRNRTEVYREILNWIQSEPLV